MIIKNLELGINNILNYNNIFQNKILCFKERLNGKLANLEQQSHERLGSFSFLRAFFLFLPKEKEKSGTMDQYAFVKNSPMNFTDPSGNFAAVAFFAAMGTVLTAIVGVMQFVAGVAAIAAGISVISNALGVSPIQVVAAIGFIVAGIFSLGFGFAAAGIALSLASPEFAKAFLFLGVSAAAIVLGIYLLPLWGGLGFILGSTLIGFGVGSAVGYLSGGLGAGTGKWDQKEAESRYWSYGTAGAVLGFAYGLISVAWYYMTNFREFLVYGTEFPTANLLAQGSFQTVVRTILTKAFFVEATLSLIVALLQEAFTVVVLNVVADVGFNKKSLNEAIRGPMDLFGNIGESIYDTVKEDFYGHRRKDFAENKFPTDERFTNAMFWSMFMPPGLAIYYYSKEEERYKDK